MLMHDFIGEDLQEVLTDPNVLYHGTSAEAGAEILRTGLGSVPPLFDRAEVERVVAIFDAIDWCGEDMAGWFLLRGYSLEWDFKDGDRKPSYLAESFHRALLYASRDWAGGEAARGIRHAIDDLERLLRQPDVYDRYRDRLSARRSNTQPVELSWLAARIAELSDLRARAHRSLADFTVGCMLAIRIEDVDLPQLRYHSMHGVMLNGRLPCERVVGTVQVPPEYVHDPFGNPPMLELPTWRGVISRLMAS